MIPEENKIGWKYSLKILTNSNSHLIYEFGFANGYLFIKILSCFATIFVILAFFIQIALFTNLIKSRTKEN